MTILQHLREALAFYRETASMCYGVISHAKPRDDFTDRCVRTCHPPYHHCCPPKGAEEMNVEDLKKWLAYKAEEARIRTREARYDYILHREQGKALAYQEVLDKLS